MRFSQNIREYRTENSLTQKQLGEILGKTKTTICDWEHGKVEPDMETLVNIADLLECSVDYLLGREDDTGMIEVNKELRPDEKYVLKAFNALDDFMKSIVVKVLDAFVDGK